MTVSGKEINLTAREFEILALLMSHPKKVFTREQIYQRVWGEEYMGDDNTVNVHVSNLRSKLGKAGEGEYIKTVWGIGFKMKLAHLSKQYNSHTIITLSFLYTFPKISNNPPAILIYILKMINTICKTTR